MARAEDGLFDLAVPEGFHYSPDFLDAAEESALVSSIERIEFSAYNCAVLLLGDESLFSVNRTTGR